MHAAISGTIQPRLLDGETTPSPAVEQTTEMMASTMTQTPMFVTTLTRQSDGKTVETTSPTMTIPSVNSDPITTAAPFECGRSKFMSQSTIMGETEATPNEFPWMVHFLIYNYTSEKYFTCGGTLVSDLHILTTSDCFFDVNLFTVNIVSITLGAHDLSANSSDRFRQIAHWSSIASTVRLNSSLVDNYFCIITLQKPVIINDYVQPACLPFDDDPDHVNEPVVLTGWGDYDASGSNSVLRKTTTTVISSSGSDGTCQQQAGLGPFSGDKIICSDGSQRYCSGDTGGPMNYYNKECDRWFVIGITGWIDDDSANCQNSNKPNLFTRVRSRLDSILLYTRTVSPSQCKLTTTTPTTTPTMTPEFTAAPTSASTPNLRLCDSSLTAASGIIQPLETGFLTEPITCWITINAPSDQVVQISCTDVKLKITSSLLKFADESNVLTYDPIVNRVYTSKGNRMFITAILNGTDRFSCQWTTVAESAITTGPSPKTTIPTTQPSTSKPPFECGRTKFTSSWRMAGGTEATPNEFPWMVHFILQNKTSGNQFTCGGTLITDRHVLSAGHCFYNADYTFGVRILNVTLGAHDMSTNSSDRFRQTIRWSSIKALSSTDSPIGNGICIITLSQPAILNEFVRPACLPLRDDPDHVNDNVILTGWDANSRSVLRKTITTVISSSGPNSTCQQQAGVGPFSGDKVICSEGYRLYCNDDAGEPMNFYNQECDRWFIIGVAGKGDASASCQNIKRTDVFTRVRSHLDWIRRNTGVDSSPIECQSTGAKSKQTTPMINPTPVVTEIPTTTARTSFECGRSKLTSTSRIVGGSEAKPNEFPWMVYILVQNFVTKKVFHCGGTLISDRHILTTSDCFFENQLFAVDILNITLGVHDLNANSSDSFRQIVKWIQIGSFVRLNNSLSAYLSIVTLGDPVELNDYVQPACLPFGDDPDHVGDPVILTGWGDYDDAAISRILRKTTTTVISSSGSNEQCQQEAGIGPFSGEKIICGDGSQQRRFCSGDVGGPMNYYNKECGRWFVIGIASKSDISDGECQSSNSKPNVFIRVRSQLNMIPDAGVVPPIACRSAAAKMTKFERKLQIPEASNLITTIRQSNGKTISMMTLTNPGIPTF